LLKGIRCIVFDLNGTIVVEDYLRYDNILEDILNCKPKFRKITAEDLREIAEGKSTWCKKIEELYDVKDPKSISSQLIKIQASRITLRKNAIEVLEELHKNYKLVLCSDTTGIATEVVKNLKISKYFDKVFFSHEVGFLKSEKDFWLNFLSNFPQIKPTEFLVVGDNPSADIYYPKSLNMHTIQIKNPNRLPQEYRKNSIGIGIPEHHIQELKEILLFL